jgi:hypothetical protein
MRIFFLSALVIFFSFTGAGAGAVFAQEANTGFLAAPAQRGDFWVCPGAETAFYSSSGVSVGGSLAAAYGSRASIGFKAAWFFDMNNELDALEINFLLRYYFMNSAEAASSVEGAPSAEGVSCAGPWIQLTGGPAMFFGREDKNSVPARYGRISAGLTFGWRFLFGNLFFAEPYIRAGYPYIAGAGVSAGVHF